jgi:hypothetical protein
LPLPLPIGFPVILLLSDWLSAVDFLFWWRSRYLGLPWLSCYPVSVRLVFRHGLPVLVAFTLSCCPVAPRELLGNCVHAVNVVVQG